MILMFLINSQEVTYFSCFMAFRKHPDLIQLPASVELSVLHFHNPLSPVMVDHGVVFFVAEYAPYRMLKLQNTKNE
jgi:hypothetical protein